MSSRKIYLIKLFIKKATITGTLTSSMNFLLQLLKNTYPRVSEEEVKNLKKSYTLDEYINRVIPIIDKRFTEEELLELIRFYSSSLGKKVINPDFFKDLQEAGGNLFREIEQKFAIKNVTEKRT